MKNLYTFLKEYKQLRESTTSERAAELGYEWQRRSVWLDPKTGKRYRADGTKFTEIPDGTGIEKPSPEPKKVEPKTLDQFRKEVPKQTPTVSSVPSDPADDEQEAEMRAVAASQGLWPHYTNARKDYHINREIQQIQADREAAQAELEVQQPEPEVPQEPQVEEPPQKDPEEFRTIDDVVNEIAGTEFRNNVGFTDKLPSTTEEYLKKINDGQHSNGVEYLDLRSVVDTNNIGVPSKYFDVLSRALVTKNIKDETDNWTHYGEGLAGGAGQINSQMGELMTLIFACASPEDREKLSEVIRSQVKSAKQKGSVKKNLTVTEDWIDASLNNASAIDRYMSLEAPGSKIVGGSWDQPDELQSLGIGEGGEKKGFSTDIVIRDSNGKNHQLSLKKDGNVNFLNSGAGQYTKFYLSGALEDESNPYHETAKEYFDNIDRVNEIYQEIGLGEYDGDGKLPNPSDWTQKRLKEIGVSDPKSMVEELKELRNALSKTRDNENIVPKEYNLSEYNRQENEALETNFKRLNSEIRNLDLDKLNTPATEIFTEYFDDGNFSDDIKERFFNSDGTPKIDPKTGKMDPADIKQGIDKDEYERAKSLLSASNKEASDGEIADKIKRIMKKEKIKDWSTFVDKLESGDLKLKLRDKNKIMLNAILATKTETGEKHRKDMKQRERDFAKNAIGAISKDPVMKAGTLKSLRNNFPLKDVSEGSESMIIGDSVFSKSVLGKMFGTNDFNQIKDKLVVEIDSSGQPYLGYSVEVDTDGNGESDNIIPISDINVRADGLGYGQTIKHEMKLRKDFFKRLQSVNEEMGTNLTTEDIMFMIFGQRKSGKQVIESLKRNLKDPLPSDSVIDHISKLI